MTLWWCHFYFCRNINSNIYKPVSKVDSFVWVTLYESGINELNGPNLHGTTMFNIIGWDSFNQQHQETNQCPSVLIKSSLRRLVGETFGSGNTEREGMKSRLTKDSMKEDCHRTEGEWLCQRQHEKRLHDVSFVMDNILGDVAKEYEGNCSRRGHGGNTLQQKTKRNLTESMKRGTNRIWRKSCRRNTINRKLKRAYTNVFQKE